MLDMGNGGGEGSVRVSDCVCASFGLVAGGGWLGIASGLFECGRFWGVFGVQGIHDGVDTLE